MRKLIFPVLILGALSACKKNKSFDDSLYTNDSSKEAISNSVTPETINLKEYSVPQIAEYLKNKDNDTLYVTNFFATWCGPCMVEIPYFKEKMEELKNQPVKFTFISIDEKEDWNTAVKDFAAGNNLQNHIVLLDNQKLDLDFFKANFEKWDGSGIPYTIMKKGQKTEETLGSMSKEMLNKKLEFFK